MTLPVIQWDGDPISKPGIYAGIPIEVYHQQLTVGPSISSSGLRDIFHKSPRAYFRGSYLNPRRKPKPPSKPFVFGRAAHHLLLGESNFRRYFTLRPDSYPEHAVLPCERWSDVTAVWDKGAQKPWSGNARVCKAWLFWQWWGRKVVLTLEDIEMIRAMAESLAEEPLIQLGALNGLIEHSFVWQHPSGIWLKWRPDAIPTDSLHFSDLKTTTDVADEALERTITEYGYNMQAALGAWACDTVLGRPMADFSLIFVEKEDVLPCVRVKTIRDADIDVGLRQLDVAVRTFARCIETNRWLGPGGEQHDAEYSGITDWGHKKIAARIDDMERQLEIVG